MIKSNAMIMIKQINMAILNCFLSDEQLYEFLYKANELCEKDCDEEEQEQVEMVAEVGYKDKDDESNEDL